MFELLWEQNKRISTNSFSFFFLCLVIFSAIIRSPPAKAWSQCSASASYKKSKMSKNGVLSEVLSNNEDGDKSVAKKLVGANNGLNAKKSNKPTFSSNEAIDGIREKTGTAEIVGFIDTIERPKIVGDKVKWSVMKFVVNNGAGKRVQVLAWEEHIKQVVDLVELNKIVHIDRAEVLPIKNQRFNIGNVNIELKIVQDTLVESKGFYGIEDEECSPPIDVTWSDVLDMEGEKIKISGWIKTSFRQSRHKSGTASYGLGAITDGKVMLDLSMISYAKEDDKWPKGAAVDVVGTVQNDKWPYLQVVNASAITLTKKESLNPDELFNIVAIPKKVSYLGSLGGYNLAETANKILKNAMKDSVSPGLTWHGRKPNETTLGTTRFAKAFVRLLRGIEPSINQVGHSSRMRW